MGWSQVIEADQNELRIALRRDFAINTEGVAHALERKRRAGHDAVAVIGRELHRVGGRCGDKRRDRRLQRLWRKAHVVRLEEFAFERHAVLGEKLLNEAQSFECLRAAVVLVHAEMFVLDREGAALCDAKIKPAFREDVDRCHVFGDLNGIAKGQQHRRGAEPKARRFRRQIRQKGETGWARSVGVEMVFGDPGFVETKRLDELNKLRLLGIGRTVIVMRVLIGAEKSRSHTWAPYQLVRCWFAEPMAPGLGRPNEAQMSDHARHISSPPGSAARFLNDKLLYTTYINTLYSVR